MTEQEVTDEQLLEIGRAALLWHALNGILTHHDRCVFWANPRRCDCGTLPFEEALNAIWEEDPPRAR